MFERAPSLGILCAVLLPMVACAGAKSDKGANESDPNEPDVKMADAKKEPTAQGTPKSNPAGVERCAVIDSTRSIAIRSQGGHARAVHDLSIELETRTLSGSAYRLEGSEPIPVEVNRTLDPKEFDPLVEYLRTVCGTTTTNPAPRDSAPGGSTRYDVFDEDGTALVLVYGASATIVPGEMVLELTRDQFKALGERWPEATPGT